MKKYIILSLLGILSGCSMYEHDIAPSTGHGRFSSTIETRSLKTFDELPDNYDFRVKFSDAELVARKCSPDKTLQEVIPFVFEEDTLFYVANYDKGYKVISGDKRTSLFLLSSDNGRFEFKEDGEFDGPSFWLSNLASDIRLLKNGKAKVEDITNVLLWSAMTGDEDPILQQDLMMRGDLDSIDFDDPDHVWALVPISDNTYYYNEYPTPHLLLSYWLHCSCHVSDYLLLSLQSVQT